MDNVWDILTKELAYYGVNLINSSECSVAFGDKVKKAPTKNVIGSIEKRIRHNGLLLEELFSELIELLCQTQPISTKDALDEITIKFFVNSLKSTCDFVGFLCHECDFVDKAIKIKLSTELPRSLNRDYTEFPKEVILSLPDLKINIDWVYRNMSILNYIRSLLMFARLGPNNIQKMNIKIARGISGPWANLDLPMLERKFPYADIAEEMSGRRRDIRQQRRYEKGFRHYNDPAGRVGEGHYWREIRNEPFSWSTGNTDSPYPSRHTLSRWG